jgi:hypothetical protein
VLGSIPIADALAPPAAVARIQAPALNGLAAPRAMHSVLWLVKLRRHVVVPVADQLLQDDWVDVVELVDV